MKMLVGNYDKTFELNVFDLKKVELIKQFIVVNYNIKLKDIAIDEVENVSKLIKKIIKKILI